MLPARSRILTIAAFLTFACTGTISAQTSYEVAAPLGATASGRPMGGLVKASNGTLYGTVSNYLAPQCGTVYKMTEDDTVTVIHQFEFTEGCHPVGELVQGSDGHLYGTTTDGGPNVDNVIVGGTGTIFRISLPDESFSMVHAFAPYDEENGWYPEGVTPFAGLTVGADGALYGTTNGGGALPGVFCPSGSSAPGGTIFRITTAGVLTVVHTLDSSTEGCAPNAGLTLGPDGNLYGTTAASGGLGGEGTIFKVTPAGSFTRLFLFAQHAGCACWADGASPQGDTVFDASGNLFGTTANGGPAGTGSGTVWRMSPTGAFTVLKGFSGADGAFPIAGLTLGSDGSIYGTTSSGGLNTIGTAFRITPAGVHELLYSFSNPTGGVPDGRLLETSRHVFLGTAQVGGDLGGGVVFRMSLPVVDITANGGDGPLVIGAAQSLRLSVGFNAFAAGSVNPGRLYIGLVAPFGVYWLTGSGFRTTPAALYSGPLPTFAPADLLTIPNGVLPAGTYLWFTIVDTDGTGDTFDSVQVVVQP